MRKNPSVPRELQDAAAVHAARSRVMEALGPLAARPLDEAAADQMRTALERATSPAVRTALRRMARPGETRPALVVVNEPRREGEPTPRPSTQTEQPDDPAGQRTTLSLVAGGDAA